MLMRSVLACGFCSILVLATPAAAATANDKMETCKFGADHQKLTGEARKKFLTKCMAEAPAPPASAKAQQ
jgi:psiF repeat